MYLQLVPGPAGGHPLADLPAVFPYRVRNPFRQVAENVKGVAGLDQYGPAIHERINDTATIFVDLPMERDESKTAWHDLRRNVAAGNSFPSLS